MGQVLHGSAKTTHAIRAAIQRSKASIQALSERYGINPKTVAKWRKRGLASERANEVFVGVTEHIIGYVRMIENLTTEVVDQLDELVAG